MLLAFGVVAAVLAARTSGFGQVVDAAMVDGAASLMTMFFAFDALGTLNHERGTNMLDTGAHFYEVYETADGAYLGVGAIERKFYEQLVELMGLERAELPDQMDQAHWPEMKERFAAVFATRTRDEWMAVFEGSDACVAPVLTMHEAKDHPHNRARGRSSSPVASSSPRPLRASAVRRERSLAHRRPRLEHRRGARRLGLERGRHRGPARRRRARRDAVAVGCWPALEIHHRTGDRARDALDPLDLAHHEPTSWSTVLASAWAITS